MEILGLVDVSTTWILLAGVLLLIYLYGKSRNQVWKRHGIKGPEPFVFIGNLPRIIRIGVNFEPSKEFGDVFGLYVGGIPTLMIQNKDLIREIMVKQFSKFPDRLVIDLDDYPINQGLFFKKGEIWRRLRRITSPTFSGSKLRLMNDKLTLCSENLTNNFLKAAQEKSEILVKDYFGAFTMDVIASTAFGIDTDSQNEMNSQLVTEARKVFGESSGVASFISLVYFVFPGLSPLLRALGFSFFPKKSMRYLSELISQLIKERRQESSTKRIDFLQLLIDAEDDGNDDITVDQRHMTQDEVLGQALLFFVAGYENTASTLHYAAYLLATNPEVQEKCYKEIQSVLGDDTPTYDNIKDLVYLDHVIDETLRLFPVVMQLVRIASETVEVCGYTIPEGCFLYVPTYKIHRNPENFPDPNKFIPERWDRKSEIDPMSYLPFGHGPRQCIGMRLAQVEMRFALATVLKKIKFLPSKGTPMTLEAKDLRIQATFNSKMPINLRVEPRL